MAMRAKEEAGVEEAVIRIKERRIKERRRAEEAAMRAKEEDEKERWERRS